MTAHPTLSFNLQRRTLCTRYWDCWFGDLATLLLLIMQAPLIGWLCTLVWGAVQHDTPSLHFVMCLACVWFGAINACREIVKERSILERERLFGLSLLAYLLSKFQVLGWIALLQTLMLQMAIEWKIAIQGAFLIQTAALWGASLCGIGLGLLISAITTTQEKAVGLIPLLILPQILFSEFSIDEQYFTQLLTIMEKLMPVHWAFEIFDNLRQGEIAFDYLIGCFLALGLYTATLGGLTWVALLPQREI